MVNSEEWINLIGHCHNIEPTNLERKGILGYSDKKRNYSESVEGIVLLLRGQNPSQVLEGVHEAVDELNNETLPPGV